MQVILSKEEERKNQLRLYHRIATKKYDDKNREEVRVKNKKCVFNKYHHDSEYRERKLQLMKLYNAKKKAEKNNVEQER